MASKELTKDIATFLHNISVSSDNGGSYDEYECNEKAEELISIILTALQDPTEAMFETGHETLYEGDYDATMDFALEPTWRAMLNASALGEQSE